ncbi:hypothetical protein Hte_005647 [Hypoxylon texense]
MDASQAGEIIKPAVPESPPVAIAPDGDVIFVVGDEQRRLKVHSVFLRTVSPVFKAMLGPHFREGANLSSDRPTVIPLPDDDPEAMEVLFNVVHYRLDAVKKRYDVEEMLYMAIALDKYDLTRALRLSIPGSIPGWLQCDGIQDPDQLWKLTKASYILHKAQTFWTATLWLIVYQAGSFYRLNDDAEIIFDHEERLAAMLEERRSRLRLELVCPFARSNQPHKGIVNKLDAAQISTESLDSTINALFGDNRASFSPANAAKYAKDVVESKIEEFVARGLGGLCLTCVRTGEDHQNHDKDKNKRF